MKKEERENYVKKVMQNLNTQFKNNPNDLKLFVKQFVEDVNILIEDIRPKNDYKATIQEMYNFCNNMEQIIFCAKSLSQGIELPIGFGGAYEMIKSMYGVDLKSKEKQEVVVETPTHIIETLDGNIIEYIGIKKSHCIIDAYDNTVYTFTPDGSLSKVDVKKVTKVVTK